MSFKQDFSEIRKVDKFINRLPKELVKPTQTKLLEAAKLVRDIAKALVNVDTGSLKKSIRVEKITKPKGVITALRIRAGGYIINPKTGRLVDYALHQEFGTRYITGNPFMRPAFESQRMRITQIMVEAAREAVRNSLR